MHTVLSPVGTQDQKVRQTGEDIINQPANQNLGCQKMRALFVALQQAQLLK